MIQFSIEFASNRERILRSLSTIYCANIAAGLMVAQFAKYLCQLPVDFDIQLNLLVSELSVGVACFFAICAILGSVHEMRTGIFTQSCATGASCFVN